MINIAIHHRAGSFSDRWIQYCEKEKIKYSLVNCFDSDIIHKLVANKVTHLMWHINHASSKDIQVFPYVLNAAENLNIKTFPNFQTRWHFDDKIAQKYLLESINAPLVESFAFFDNSSAKKFIENASYPLVAKLKRGAGATNVELLKNKQEANQYINEMFTIGKDPGSSTFDNIDQKLRVAKRIKNPIALAKKVIKYFIKNNQERLISNFEKGYVYFQKFLPNNSYDTRIIVINNKAFGLRRFNRKNDFRASGSGIIDFSTNKIDLSMVKISFDVTSQLKAQSVAFDFVYDNKTPKIVEICFGFSMNSYNSCEGYWQKDLVFVKGPFNPQVFMINDFINEE
jgi:glutathione synthase/RimK-type ligase-like ATP-grasp enzyme